MIRKRRNTPYFSIVIVVGPERTEEVKRCLDSVLNSKYKQFEILIVDNSCSSSLGYELKNKYPTVSYIPMSSNTGIKGFNIGFQRSRGKYIVALDDDACILPDTLTIIRERINHYPSVVGVIGCNSYNPSTQKYYHENYMHNHSVSLYNQTIGGTVFKKEIFAKSGYYDEDFFCWMHEDDLFIRIRNAGYVAIFDPMIQIHHFDCWSMIRINMYFFMFRNFVWLTMKYFSVWYIPILLARNILTLVLLPLKKKSLIPFMSASAGFIAGLITIFTPLLKRKVVNADIQKEYVHYYVLNKFASIYSVPE